MPTPMELSSTLCSHTVTFLVAARRTYMEQSSLVADAHAAGLEVHPWTLRKENGFLPASLQNEGGPSADGQYQRLFRAAIASGADGFFTDNVKELVAILGEE